MGRTVAVALCTVVGFTLVACSTMTYKPGPLSNSTPCGVLNADQSAGDSEDITDYLQIANPYLANDAVDVQIQGEMDILPDLLGECQNSPAELLSAAYNKALDRSLAPSSTSEAPAG